MALIDELKEQVASIFKSGWTERDGTVVPESEDLKLTNDAVKLDGVVLYSDISGSTRLVDSYKPHFAAEVYKTFLYCAARLIRHHDGVVTAYDGDRVMGVYLGNRKNNNAARTALRINWAKTQVIMPALKAQYPASTFELRQVTSVDNSNLFVARTGVRGANDLVWIGRAANHAAKMTGLSSEYASYITEDVYAYLDEASKEHDGKAMWERANWTEMNRVVYRSKWWWAP